MRNFFKIILTGIIIFVVIVLVMFLLGIGLYYLMQVVPCELIAYVETGFLFIIVLLIALLLDKRI